MNAELTLSEMLLIAKNRRGLKYDEIIERLRAIPRADGKPRGRLHPGTIKHYIDKGERMQIRALAELCEAMDCELEIKITPRTTKLEELNKNLERSC